MPEILLSKAFLHKLYLYASAEMTFTLFYREECEKFYPTIADFFQFNIKKADLSAFFIFPS